MRPMCYRCIQPLTNCYCELLRPFDPLINFVILIHPIEARRRIATGRMAHLSLLGSFLVKGENFTDHPLVNSLILDPEYQSMILYPGKNSLNISLLSRDVLNQTFALDRKLRIFVIDGTWSKAKTMLRLSSNLAALPQIAFNPRSPSKFIVRRQPHPNFISTIEAIHQTIDLLGKSQSFNSEARTHDSLLVTFESLVNKQILYSREKRSPRFIPHPIDKDPN